MYKPLSPAEAEFWLDTEKYANYFDQNLSSGEELIFSINMVRLSSVRKAISNFVKILTRQDIPVYFNDADTTANFGGKTIYISAEINNKHDFDVAVGQALHEAAHTLLTDFDATKIAYTNIPHHIFVKSDAKGIRRASLEKFIHTMWNVIEDRYIDDYVFECAPGYRGYYVSLYDRFFNNPRIDEYLKGDMFRYPSLDSYAFRIINFTNENTDLTALPRLDDIADIIDIAHISRLKTTQDRLNTAFQVVDVVLDCLEKESAQDFSGQAAAKATNSNGLAKPEDFFDFGDNDGENKESEKDNSSAPENSTENETSGDNGGDANDDDDDDDESKDEAEVDVGKDMVQEMSDVMTGKDTEPETLKENKQAVTKISNDDIDKRLAKDLKEITEDQRKFLRGELPKATITPQQKQLLDLIEKHGIVLVRVDAPELLSGNGNFKVDCIVVQSMTKDLVLSGEEMFPLCSIMKFGKETPQPPEKVAEAVKKGIALGSKLGRKLQLRNEITQTKNIRKRSGKIFRRQLHEAAFDAEDLFYNIRIEQHNQATLHISVDASSSMQGTKWYQTMTSVVAICKATSMIDNIHVTVSFRATQLVGTTHLPYIVLAYDSKKDSFNKVRTLFPYLKPNGFTPEGLAYGALMGLFENITPDEEDRYFLNLSDGEPCLHITVPNVGILNYFDEAGVSHTKKQVDKLRAKGLNILSYFIDDSSVTDTTAKSRLTRNFQKMYGKNAAFINVESIVELAKTMNHLFLIKATH